MRYQKLIKVAARSILKNRMRSLLTMLGIIIGVAAVIVMVAIGQGAQARIENEISSLGTNLIIVFPTRSQMGGVRGEAGSFNRLTMKDSDKLKREASLLENVSPVVRSGGQVIGGGTNWNTSIYGVSPEYLEIRGWELESGMFFTEREDQARGKVAVLGHTVAENLFPDQDPVGRQIRVRNVPFKVIGVLTEKGQSAMGSDQDDVILTPSNTVLYRLSGGQYIHEILASAVSVEQITAAQEEIRALLREEHRLDFGEADDFEIRNQTEITEAASETARVLTLLLGAIAGVSLIVGGIGIMNIMLVSVTERTREIGIRLAVGARGVDVLTQFLIEAMVLSLIGGLIGVLVAIAVASLLGSLTDLTTVIHPGIVLVAFVFSGGIGVFFGFYPARKAAALDPIEALRHE
jgi:putative ABC transport system permease protein